MSVASITIVVDMAVLAPLFAHCILDSRTSVSCGIAEKFSRTAVSVDMIDSGLSLIALMKTAHLFCMVDFSESIVTVQSFAVPLNRLFEQTAAVISCP